MSELVHTPYENPAHQEETAISGMWLFLASEGLLFGGLFLVCLLYSHAYGSGWSAGVQRTNLAIGTANTVILITSSAAFSLAVEGARAGNNRRVIQGGLAASALGVLFLVLKGVEWAHELGEHLFPGAHFGLTGPAAGGASLYYTFYFIATGLHGLHLLGGIGLLLWICVRARQGEFTRAWNTPVDAVGLYWSFVDLMWMVLFPIIYLLGRTS
jgi:cytochrome c oxidase subunit 3